MVKFSTARKVLWIQADFDSMEGAKRQCLKVATKANRQMGQSLQMRVSEQIWIVRRQNITNDQSCCDAWGYLSCSVAARFFVFASFFRFECEPKWHNHLRQSALSARDMVLVVIRNKYGQWFQQKMSAVIVSFRKCIIATVYTEALSIFTVY